MPEDDLQSVVDTLTLDSEVSELERLREFIEAFCGRAALPEQACYHVSVAIEELAVNSIKHGLCEPRKGAIHITLCLKDDLLHIEFSDNGIPFNPLEAPPPDLNQDLGKRPIGGLGIHLVRCLLPEIRYERRDGRNHLILIKPLDTNRGRPGRKG